MVKSQRLRHHPHRPAHSSGPPAQVRLLVVGGIVAAEVLDPDQGLGRILGLAFLDKGVLPLLDGLGVDVLAAATR